MKDNPLRQQGESARAAARQLQGVDNGQRSRALMRMAELVRSHMAEILEANALDVEEAERNGRIGAFIDRLMLNPDRVEQMATGMEKVAGLPDPIGECIAEFNRPNGMHIRQVRVPIGVIGFIYESRSSVTCDAAALCLKSGNAVILRGGKESARTNDVLIRLIRSALVECGFPENAVQLISGGNRDEVVWLCELEGLLDVIIPRGGKGLVSTVVEHARMPVLKHLDGICHTYVDADADQGMALNICDDAKTQRPGVCNAMETVLVHGAVASDFLPRLACVMEKRGVELRGCPRSLPLLGDNAIPATEEDWSTEYEDLILSVCVVDSVAEAIDHINRYGSHHSDAIVTRDDKAAEQFMTYVDSACVYRNCSTRFSDGEEYGFGAEIGIGTDKLHARGPMGLRELTSYKYIVDGNGQVKDASRLL